AVFKFRGLAVVEGHPAGRLDPAAEGSTARRRDGRVIDPRLGIPARTGEDGRHAEFNTMAIAPTATISNICGVSQSIEPAYQNLFVKSNMSGDFTVVNAQLVRDLKERGLWDEVMVSDLKYFD